MSLAYLWSHCSVILTDVLDAEELIRHNLKSFEPASGSSIQFEVLEWDHPVLPRSCQKRPHDLVVVSDCTYNEDSIPVLIRTMKLLTLNSLALLVFVALKRRHANEDIFFTSMGEAGFDVVDSTKVLLPHVFGTSESSEFSPDSSNVVIELYLFRQRS